MFVTSRSTHGMRLSPKLFSAFCPCPPQPAAAKEAALPSPTSCVRPVCGFGLQSASAGCEYTPVPPTEGRRDVGLRGTGAAADPSSLCPCQLRCAAALQAPVFPWETQSPKGTRQALGQQLSNQTLAERAPHEDGTQRQHTQRGGRNQRTCVAAVVRQ